MNFTLRKLNDFLNKSYSRSQGLASNKATTIAA